MGWPAVAGKVAAMGPTGRQALPVVMLRGPTVPKGAVSLQVSLVSVQRQARMVATGLPEKPVAPELTV